LAQSGYFEQGPDGVKVDARRVEDDSWIAKVDFDNVRSQSTDDSAPPMPKLAPSKPSSSTPPTNYPLPYNAAPLNQYDFGNWIGTKASRDESRNPDVSVTSHFEDFARRPFIMADKPKVIEDDGLSPITPIFRAQSMDPLRPPQSFGFDAGPPDDPFGKALTNPEDDTSRMPPEYTDLDVTVADGRTGKLMFGVGVNSNAGLVGNIVLSENNFDYRRPPQSWNDIATGNVFRGGGQKFKIEAQPGTQVSRYLVDWQDPYFMDSDFNLGVSGFYFLRYYRNWYEERVGGKIRVGRQVTQHWSANAAIRLEDVDIYNPTTPSPQELTNVLGSTLLSTVRGAIVHDTRDAAFNSGQGHYFELSYEQAFGQFNYPRVETEFRQYWTTYRRVDGQGKHTISARGNLGWSGNDTPIYEHFFAGGFQNFRGFAFRGVSPVSSNVYVGGDFMALGSLEYMLPVTANEMVKVVAFTDFGTVNTNVSLDNFRLSVGSGFRLSIPMMGPVPIAVDFAVPLMQQSTDIRQVVSFYVGMNR
jgi:outer membrane protein insertion porin family